MLFKKKNLYIDHFKNLSLKVKKKKIFLVSGNASFTGNSKYFFLNALSSKINFEMYYVTYQRELFDELNSFNLPVILFHNECSVSPGLPNNMPPSFAGRMVNSELI